MAQSRGITVSLLAGLLLAGGYGLCQETAPAPQYTEHELKAAFLYNFAKFTEWPPTVFTNTSAPLVFGVLGADPLCEALKETLRGKTLGSRELAVVALRSAAEARTNCHILFISTSEQRHLAEIFAGLSSASVLTVAEIDQFTQGGGMIRLVRQGTKIRFQVNVEAAKKAGLKIRSKLLELAEK